MSSTEHTFHVQGMTCQHCVNNVHNRLAQIQGVQNVRVQLMPPRAYITAEQIDLAQLQSALEGTQFSIQASA